MIPRSTRGESHRATRRAADVAMRRGTRRHHSSLATHTTVPRPVVVIMNHTNVSWRRSAPARAAPLRQKISFPVPLPRRLASFCDALRRCDEPFIRGAFYLVRVAPHYVQFPSLFFSIFSPLPLLLRQSLWVKTGHVKSY